MDEASWENVIDDLYLAISGHVVDLQPVGTRPIPRFTNLAGISSCIWNLALSFLPRSTLVTEIQARTSREIGQLANKLVGKDYAKLTKERKEVLDKEEAERNLALQLMRNED